MRLCEIENLGLLASEEDIGALLHALILGLEMTKLAGPIYGSVEDSEDENGISGIVLIKESHIAIHTYEERKTLFLDIFSCKAFEEKTVISILATHLKKYVISEQNIHTRGHHWDQPIDSELKKWIGKR